MKSLGNFNYLNKEINFKNNFIFFPNEPVRSSENSKYYFFSLNFSSKNNFTHYRLDQIEENFFNKIVSKQSNSYFLKTKFEKQIQPFQNLKLEIKKKDIFKEINSFKIFLDFIYDYNGVDHFLKEHLVVMFFIYEKNFYYMENFCKHYEVVNIEFFIDEKNIQSFININYDFYFFFNKFYKDFQNLKLKNNLYIKDEQNDFIGNNESLCIKIYDDIKKYMDDNEILMDQKNQKTFYIDVFNYYKEIEKRLKILKKFFILSESYDENSSLTINLMKITDFFNFLAMKGLIQKILSSKIKNETSIKIYNFEKLILFLKNDKITFDIFFHMFFNEEIYEIIKSYPNIHITVSVFYQFYYGSLLNHFNTLKLKSYLLKKNKEQKTQSFKINFTPIKTNIIKHFEEQLIMYKNELKNSTTKDKISSLQQFQKYLHYSNYELDCFEEMGLLNYNKQISVDEIQSQMLKDLEEQKNLLEDVIKEVQGRFYENIKEEKEFLTILKIIVDEKDEIFKNLKESIKLFYIQNIEKELDKKIYFLKEIKKNLEQSKEKSKNKLIDQLVEFVENWKFNEEFYSFCNIKMKQIVHNIKYLKSVDLKKEKEEVCCICFDKRKDTLLECGHMYCKQCLDNHYMVNVSYSDIKQILSLKNKINEKKIGKKRIIKKKFLQNRIITHKIIKCPICRSIVNKNNEKKIDNFLDDKMDYVMKIINEKENKRKKIFVTQYEKNKNLIKDHFKENVILFEDLFIEKFLTNYNNKIRLIFLEPIVSRNWNYEDIKILCNCGDIIVDVLYYDNLLETKLIN